jgi:hypothetical protein
MAAGSSNAPGATYPEVQAVGERANKAVSAASAAQSQAGEAESTAKAAMEKANEAENKATAAEQTAGEAKDAADAAAKSAASVADTASAAQQTANEAKNTADAAAKAAAAAQQTASDVSQALTDLNSTINSVPSQSGALTYTGSAQSPTWNGYDTDKLTIGGTTSGTAAGSYNATFTPKDGYKWSDGSTDAKTVSWSIGRATVAAPTQSGTITYTGSSQSPTWSGYDTAKMTIGGTTKGTDAGDYNATFTPTANYQWSDGTTTAKTVKWSIAKAAGSLTVASTLSITAKTAQTLAVTRAGDGAVSATSSDTSVATVSVSGTTLTITPKKDGTTTITVSVAAGTNHTAPASKTCTVTVTWPKIYGVQWDGTSTTAWTRTDDAALFTDPVPYVKGASSYSSPFDNLQPWAGMTRVTDSTAGELVKIPKFWYKWTKSGNTLKLQISDQAQDGFHVSPAHADRGDGKGERDVVYVGRYHCGATAYKSATGQKPKVSITRSAARSAIAALGTGIYQYDMAMRVTIQMLYLVEFADWDSQKKIGYGRGNNSAVENMGASDSMPYHTGTMQTSRTTYGVGVQYRYIEGLWDNCLDWLDGCYYSSAGLSIIMNPANFSDTSGGTAVGTPSSGYPTVMAVATASGLEWVIYPTTANGSNTTYVPDYWDFNASNPCLRSGGNYGQNLGCGLFCVNCNAAADAGASIGCRLQKLP